MAGMNCVLLFSEEVGISGVVTSEPIDISKANALAIHHNETAGTGTITYTYSLSPSRAGTYIIPTSPVTIGADVTADDILDFAPEAAKFIKIIATESGGSAAVTVTSTLVIQEL